MANENNFDEKERKLALLLVLVGLVLMVEFFEYIVLVVVYGTGLAVYFYIAHKLGKLSGKWGEVLAMNSPLSSRQAKYLKNIALARAESCNSI